MLVNSRLSFEEIAYGFNDLPHEIYINIAFYLSDIKDLNSLYSVSKNVHQFKSLNNFFGYYKICADLMKIHVEKNLSPKNEVETYIKIHRAGGSLFPWLARCIGPSKFGRISTIPESIINEAWEKTDCNLDSQLDTGFEFFSLRYQSFIEEIHFAISVLQNPCSIYKAIFPNKVQFVLFNCLFFKTSGLYKKNQRESVSVFDNSLSHKEFRVCFSNLFHYSPIMIYFENLASGKPCKNFDWATDDWRYFEGMNDSFDLIDEDNENCVILCSEQ